MGEPTKDLPKPLKFKVAPHIVEDLGLNLYTDLPRVLAEFVANAYDADSPSVDVLMEREKIESARARLKKAYELDRASDTAEALMPLAKRTLPDDIKIVIRDGGHGMSRSELDRKFLVAGRRRRKEDDEVYTPNGRVLMGRKGLGKLAGFGVAKVMEVLTKKKDESHATKIVLDFDKLTALRTTDEIEIVDTKIDGSTAIGTQGTQITLYRLLYDPLKSREATIESELGEHFELIRTDDFAIRFNGKMISPAVRTHSFAWPRPEVPHDELVSHTLETEAGQSISFQYRLRFTGERQALPAARRGVRVYAHNRLAAAPSLLKADTNMHGFRMTDYLDGVVSADFLDNEETDYIATDRQSLRWDAPLLSPLHEFLSDEIKQACRSAQAKRDDDAPKEVERDDFTIGTINKQELSKRDRELALRIAANLKSACKQGVDDPIYRAKLPAIVQGIGHGNVLAAIAELADQKNPDLARVAVQVARLTKDELDRFLTSVKARMRALDTFMKIVQSVKFGAKDDEKQVQKLFEKSPWIIDPTYTQFLSANQRLDTTFDRLARVLGIGAHAPADDDDRADLVFLLGNENLRRLVIIELKAPNVKLDKDHLDQLLYYMERAEGQIREWGLDGFSVTGELIGSKADDISRAKKVMLLRRAIRQAGPETPWRVRDYLEVLRDTRAAHNELLVQHNADADDAEMD